MCWGQEVLHPMPDPPEGQFVDLSMTHGYACAVRVDSELVCWSPGSSSLMDGDRSAAPQGDGFAAVSVGSGHACALRTDGPVVCWGLNRFGQVDPFDPEEGEAALGRDPLAGPYVQVSGTAKTDYTPCGIRTDGTVQCWSWAGPSPEPPPPGRFELISVERRHGCGIRTDGSVACWGSNHEPPWQPPLPD